ncbi:MAG: ATP-binding protein [Candidatus Cloacimonetes bacterium]|nr:ATP-binding protein [Candidatus Cloacimonadota bacterium]
MMKRLLSWLLLLITAFGLAQFLILKLSLSRDAEFWLLLLIYMGAAIASYYLSKRFSVPLEHLDDALKRLGRGHLEDTLPLQKGIYHDLWRHTSEVQRLLLNYHTLISENKEGFQAIIGNIHEALWIQNKKGVIKNANRTFLRIIGVNDIKDRYFWNVIRVKELYDFVDNVFKNPGDHIEEISFNDGFFICSSSYTPLTEEIIFILYDISEIRQLEIMKKDFVRNVSHELRTPLTAIKGYVETLSDEVDAQQQSYLEVISRNTDRLIHIVNDLLTLSKLEHESQLQYETIDPQELVASIRRMFVQRLDAKGLKLRVAIPADFPSFRGDRFKLEQVFINLIDNAVKYTDSGEITIDFSRGKVLTRIQIKDTGQGIESHHLSRLFERFYVVDKSRSRKLGGTGLGLSIVKHIIGLHRGTIEVQSCVGRGTQFTITLPDIL